MKTCQNAKHSLNGVLSVVGLYVTFGKLWNSSVHNKVLLISVLSWFMRCVLGYFTSNQIFWPLTYLLPRKLPRTVSVRKIVCCLVWDKWSGYVPYPLDATSSFRSGYNTVPQIIMLHSPDVSFLPLGSIYGTWRPESILVCCIWLSMGSQNTAVHNTCKSSFLVHMRLGHKKQHKCSYKRMAMLKSQFWLIHGVCPLILTFLNLHLGDSGFEHSWKT